MSKVVPRPSWAVFTLMVVASCQHRVQSELPGQKAETTGHDSEEKLVTPAADAGNLSPPNRSQSPVDDAPEDTAQAASTEPELSGCPDVPSVPRLERLDAETNGTMWLDLTFDSEQSRWVPAERLATMRHHGNRIEWQNADDFGLQKLAIDQTVRATVTILDRSLSKVPGEHRWRGVYRARIEALCRPSSDVHSAVD